MDDASAESLHGRREAQTCSGGHFVKAAGHDFALQDVIDGGLASNAHSENIGPLEIMVRTALVSEICKGND